MCGMDAGELSSHERLAEVASQFAVAILRLKARRCRTDEDAESGPENCPQAALNFGPKRGSVSTRVNGFESP